MYRYLWSNGPREGLESSDHSFDAHPARPIASYPPRAVLLDYIEGRVNAAGVKDWFRFNTVIRWVSYDTASEKFHVTAYDHKKDSSYTERFDQVVEAPGYFSTPNMNIMRALKALTGGFCTLMISEMPANSQIRIS